MRYPTSKGRFDLSLVVVRNMLTGPRGMPMLGNKKPNCDEVLFDCASCRTQGSSAETVHSAAIAGLFLCLFTMIFYCASVQRLILKQLLIIIFNLCVFLQLMHRSQIDPV